MESTNRERQVSVLGISGGLDSTCALISLVSVYEKLKLPKKDIVCISMPGFGTSDLTKNNAFNLCKELDVTYLEIPIGSDQKSGISNLVLKTIGHDTKTEDLTFENVQAMTRTLILYSEANKRKGTVIGTGDWSESLIGWLTKYGDGAFDYGANTGIAKSIVKFLLIQEKSEYKEKNPKVADILSSIIYETPVSPELKRTVEGEISQKTDDINGSITLRDFFGYHLMRNGYSLDHIAYLANVAFSKKESIKDLETYSPEEIKMWLTVFIKKVVASSHKRNVLPPGPKVGLSNSGRYDNQWPQMGVSLSAFERELKRIPV